MQNHPPPPPVPPSGGPPRPGGGTVGAAQPRPPLPRGPLGGVMGAPPGVFVTEGVHGQSVAFSPYHGNLFAVAGSQNYGIAGGYRSQFGGVQRDHLVVRCHLSVITLGGCASAPLSGQQS